MTAYVIADLHLTAGTPELLAAFRKFAGTVAGGDSLYILGDLFGYYVGPDPRDPAQEAVREVGAALAARGARVYFLRGNRDFLMSEQDAAYFGFGLLDDVTTADFGGTSVLMVHGDELCDEKLSYRIFRRAGRCKLLQKLFFLCTAPEGRVRVAERLRDLSMKSYAKSGGKKILVNPEKAAAAARRRAAAVLIHGHTHHAEEIRSDGLTVFDTGDWRPDSYTYLKITAAPGGGGPSFSLVRVEI